MNIQGKIMKNFNISMIGLAIGLAFSTSAMAESMSKNQFESHLKNIEAEYKLAKVRCDSFAGNTNDICVAEAKGKSSIAKADLEASYKPSVKTLYDARITKADADYSVATEKCDDKAGNDKGVCVKEAEAAKVNKIADAKTNMNTSKANAVANEESDDAKAKATKKKADAHKSAASDKHDANYTVAKEKCRVLAGAAKDQCMSNAKVRFGQQFRATMMPLVTTVRSTTLI
jgi:hypothetical protein